MYTACPLNFQKITKIIKGAKELINLVGDSCDSSPGVNSDYFLCPFDRSLLYFHYDLSFSNLFHSVDMFLVCKKLLVSRVRILLNGASLGLPCFINERRNFPGKEKTPGVPDATEGKQW